MNELENKKTKKTEEVNNNINELEEKYKLKNEILKCTNFLKICIV